MNYDDLINRTLNSPDITEEGLAKTLASGALGLSLALGGAKDTKAQEKTPIENIVPTKVNLDKLLDVLQYVESKNNPKAIGDNGKAYGVLQIWNVVVDDVNRVYKTNYKHEDAFDVAKARDIAKKYLTFWGNRYTKNENKPLTYEVLARIWNGGPKGYKKSATDNYWERVKEKIG